MATAAIAGASLARALGKQSRVVDGFLVTAETAALIVRQLFAVAPEGSWRSKTSKAPLQGLSQWTSEDGFRTFRIH
jgi:hypothetical protein